MFPLILLWSTLWLVFAILVISSGSRQEEKRLHKAIRMSFCIVLLALPTIAIALVCYSSGVGVPDEKPHLSQGRIYELVCSGQVNEDKYIVNLSQVGKDKVISCYIPQVPPKQFLVTMIGNKTAYIEVSPTEETSF